MGSSFARHLSGIAVAASLFATLASAQQSNRIPEEIDAGSAAALPGSVNPRIGDGLDMGRIEPATPMVGVTMYFQPTADQKAQLDALVEAQQTPGSPYYHAWLTPAEYASRFGLNDADLARVQNWLESQGFNVERVANSHTSISFSGTASQIESAFQTEMHRYQIGAETHVANATELAIPAALAGVVRSIRNLDDFRPRPQFRPSPAGVQPAFTSAQSGAHYLSPKDITTIYDINGAYNSGYTGSGQTIAVVGQSEVVASDITAFQSAAGLTVKAPTMILVPGTGTAAVSTGDEAESDLDLEYSGGTATGASIDFVYVGNNQNYSVFDALQYAIDNKTASILSISYGACEPDISSTNYTALEGIMEQASSQGQTVVAASGDSGSTACYDPTTKNPVTAAMEALAVNYPASSAYAVGVGGTEFPTADVASGNTTYWKSTSGSDLVNSALSYIPEQAWNDDSAAIGQTYGPLYAVSSGGGGISTLTPRPSWQTGVTGIPSGSFRLVPDVSLVSSPDNAPYLYCTSDNTSWTKGQAASCNSGFRDSSTQDLTVAGGTSFATPIFAGMLAIIAQKENSTGLGVANKTIYSLAANSSTYASAFHDTTSGSNKCTAGTSYCSTAGASKYATTAGYDEATGLGSVDFNNLMTDWSGGTTSGGGGTGTGSFTLTATAVTVTQGASGTSSVTITPQSSYAGTVGFSVTSTATSLNTNGCYTISNTAVTAGKAAAATLTIYTSQSACSGVSGAHSFVRSGGTKVASSRDPQPLRGQLPIGAAAFAGMLLLGFSRSRKAWSVLSCLVLVAMLGFATGCGSSSGSSTVTNTTSTTSTDVATGSYTLTVAGTDTTTSSITASTTVALTVN
ncbi:MAG TPA: S53 family peptidase [Acidobacteriaceae bacterium]|jgi:subtilase family serine protease|nr:S53 family peptidase [Acidobacteriaceae bacterium]